MVSMPSPFQSPATGMELPTPVSGLVTVMSEGTRAAFGATDTVTWSAVAEPTTTFDTVTPGFENETVAPLWKPEPCTRMFLLTAPRSTHDGVRLVITGPGA